MSTTTAPCSVPSDSGSSDKDDALPTQQQISTAAAANIADSKGSQVAFSSLLDNAKANNVPLLLVFTRHFHCGMCMEFVRALKQSTTLTDASKVSLVIVGPGQPEAIERYKDQTDNPPFQFYADPHLKLYHALGVTTRNLVLGEGASHHKQSFAANLARSVAEIVKSGSLATKGGDIKQLGGEFVFSAGGEPVFAHRMKHTKDHSEISQLERAVTQASQPTAT